MAKLNPGQVKGLLGEQADAFLFSDGMNVFRVSKDSIIDTSGYPAGARWECTITHFKHYRDSVFAKSWKLNSAAMKLSKKFATPAKVEFRIARKLETDEWLVKVFVNGQYSEDRTYYTDDEQDARDTMRAMIAEEKRKPTMLSKFPSLALAEKQAVEAIRRFGEITYLPKIPGLTEAHQVVMGMQLEYLSSRLSAQAKRDGKIDPQIISKLKTVLNEIRSLP